MYKLLICYDISKIKSKLNESNISNKVIKEIESQYYWIHFQESVWIVLSNNDREKMYNNLLNKINTNKDTLLSVIDITNQDILYNHIRDCKNTESNTKVDKEEKALGLDLINDEINTPINYKDVLTSKY